MTSYHRREPEFYKVRMSGEVMRALVELASQAKGATVTVDWGDPDADDFYTPTLTVTNEAVRVLDEAKR